MLSITAVLYLRIIIHLAISAIKVQNPKNQLLKADKIPSKPYKIKIFYIYFINWQSRTVYMICDCQNLINLILMSKYTYWAEIILWILGWSLFSATP